VTVKVSIITPSFNQGSFIEETISSVLNQSYQNIEYIVMDGGSTDNTLDILRKFDRNPRFKWFSSKDKGQSNAINKGFTMATGSILAWLNSDDVYENSDVVKCIVDTFIKYPDLDLVYGRCSYIDAKGNFTGPYRSLDFNHNHLLNHDSGMIPQASCFFTSRVINKTGGLDESLHYSMDYDLWLRISKQGKCLHIPDVLSKFRKHDGCKTVSKVYHSRIQSWYVSVKNGGHIISILFLRLVYTTLKELNPMRRAR